jgi:uncharacterized protein
VTGRPFALDPLLAAVRARSTGIGSQIHGERHWRTVGANGLWLAESVQVDTRVVLLFALLHDTMRLNDARDPEHGPRAAAFAVALHEEGLLAVTDEQLDLLHHACFEHADGTVSTDPTVGVCWDADRLDLPRVGITPRPDLFSTAAARNGGHPTGEPPEWVELYSAEQLSSLAHVGLLLEDAGISYWVFGGWAVDFYAGSITRAHDDVDVAVWLDDLPRIAELLRTDGWRHAPEEDEDGGTGYERGSVRLELTYLVRDGEGRILTPMSHGPAVWPEDSFADDAGELRGVRSRLIRLTSLLHAKSSPRDDPAEAARDRADFDRLQRRLR